MTTPTQQISDELQVAFDHFNVSLFESQLPPTMLTLQRKAKTGGYFSPERFISADGKTKIDEIALNPEYFAVLTLEYIMSIIVHEQAHQHVHHQGTGGRRGYHNSAWANTMVEIGLMPTDTGQPGGRKVGERMDHYIMPGGKFQLCCQQLLTSQFKLSWFDRYPARDFVRSLADLANPPAPGNEEVSETCEEASNESPRQAEGSEQEPLESGLDQLSTEIDPNDEINPFKSDDELAAKEEEKISHPGDEKELPKDEPKEKNKAKKPSPIAREKMRGGEDPTGQLGFLRDMGVPVDELSASGKKSKSNRWKYSCPDCGVNIWGKPDLNIVCGECEKPFTGAPV